MSDYKLIRARRRTVAIYVTREANVEVRAPMCMPEQIIDGFVQARKGWIELHVEKRKHILANRALFRLDYESAVRFRGQTAVITASDAKKGFEDGRFYLPPGIEPEEIKRAVKKAYIEHARALLPERTAVLAQKLGVSPSAVKVNRAKAQWGSCSGKNSICYSWRLIMAGNQDIDYVVTHELAHISEHNHSPRFWAVVERHAPQWRLSVERLAELQRQLLYENWD